MPATAADGPALAEAIRLVAEQEDRSAYRQLFDHYAPRIRSLYLRQGLSEDHADDLVQEVMLILWRKAGSYDAAQAHPNTWVFTIARNRRIDQLRRQQKTPLEADGEEILAMIPAEDDPAGDLLKAEDGVRVRAAMAGLSNEQADLVKRAFFAGKTHRAIADETGLPLGTVKSRIRLALSHLRRAIDGEAA